jgi:uncharacterized membrane protein
VETIKDLENNSRWEEDILHERMKKGTITTDDKKAFLTKYSITSFFPPSFAKGYS